MLYALCMPEERQHLYGLDVLRILAMYFVCVLHVGGGFGALKNAPDIVTQCGTASCLALANVAVNIFMMITGYIGISHCWRWRGYVKVWGEVAFYSLAGILFCWCFLEQCYSLSSLRELLFPIPLANGYWYFTAYTGAFFLFPYANRLLQNLTRREYGKLVLIFLISVGFFGIWNNSVGSGYNAVWLLMMYCTGGYIRLHLPRIPQWIALGMYLLFSAISATFFAAGIYLKKVYGWEWGMPAFGYTSPWVIMASLGCFVFCVQLKIQNSILCRLLRFAAPLTFAVYLIHEHPCMEPLFRQLSAEMANCDHYAVWHTPLTALIIYLICSAVDWFRRWTLSVFSAPWKQRKI